MGLLSNIPGFNNFANSDKTNDVTKYTDIVPNVNSTETRGRFDIDTNDWNIPKMTHQFYVVFSINENAFGEKSYANKNIEQVKREQYDEGTIAGNLELALNDKAEMEKVITMNKEILSSKYVDQSTTGSVREGLKAAQARLNQANAMIKDCNNKIAYNKSIQDKYSVPSTLSDYMDSNEGLSDKFKNGNQNIIFWDNIRESAKDYADIASMMVKSCDKPSWKSEVKTYNQYNRKRLVSGKVTYTPIKITFHDDVKSSIDKLLAYQLSLYDNTYLMKGDSVYSQFSQLDRFMNFWNSKGWGADIYSNTNIFKRIHVIEWFKNKCTFWTLHNPKITDVSYKNLSLDNSGTGEISITFDYEGLDNTASNDLGQTSANGASTDFSIEPMLGGQITPEIAEAIRAQYENNAQSILNGIMGMVDAYKNGGKAKDILTNAASTFGFGEEVNTLKQITSIPKNIKDKGIGKVAWDQVSNPASVTGKLSNSGLSKITNLFKG